MLTSTKVCASCPRFTREGKECDGCVRVLSKSGRVTKIRPLTDYETWSIKRGSLAGV